MTKITTPLCLLFSASVLAAPMEQMNQRVKVYAESKGETCNTEVFSPDEGIFIDVSCSIKCAKKDERIEKINSPFIPRNLGLKQGNGSSQDMILWGGLGVALKRWSENLCLTQAVSVCKKMENVESINVQELASGEWKIDHFPGCKESKITISPFYDEAKPSRVPQIAAVLESQKVKKTDQYEVVQGGFKLVAPFAKISKDKPENCKKIIKASLCFGDCVDLNSKQFAETLGTADPLGSEDVEICGDELFSKLNSSKVSKPMRQKMCEDYFWASLMNTEDIIFKSCAALRGQVLCEEF